MLLSLFLDLAQIKMLDIFSSRAIIRKLSLATSLSAFVFNNMAGCHLQANWESTHPRHTKLISSWLRCAKTSYRRVEQLTS